MGDGTLPSALEHLEEIRQTAAGKSLVIFLDYDGTLTPIVSSPEKAVLAQEMRNRIERLSKRYMVAVISGRGLRDVQQHVGVEGIYYAGSHGFEIAGPRGEQEEYEPGKEFLPVLDDVEKEIRAELEGIEGVFIERKKFSLAIHFRQTRQDDLEAVKSAADRAAKQHAGLRLSSGKKIYELQPKIDWHKGKALHRVLELAGLDNTDVVPVYIGDDVTDEDAFRAIRSGGVSIVVGNEPRPTQARYALRNTDEVGRFLEALASSEGG
jgi:trehalose-phosphatase